MLTWDHHEATNNQTGRQGDRWIESLVVHDVKVERSAYTFYAGEVNVEQLLSKLGRMMDAEEICSDPPEVAAAFACRVAIVYKTQDELRRKLKALR